MSLQFCSLASGSSGNCQYVGTKDTKLLVDAGLTGKYIKNALDNIDIDIKGIDGLLVTHEHNDHIKAIGVLMRRYNIPLFVNERTWDMMKDKIGKIDEDSVRFLNDYNEFYIGDIAIKPYSISHDASDPIGFSFIKDKGKISIATDLGYINEEIINQIKDSDLLVIEANHDVEMVKVSKYPWFLKKRILSEVGHLSNETAGEIVSEVVQNGNVNNVVLAHLSKENNFPELAYETVKNIVEEKNIKVGLDINLDLTYRDRISRVYNIKK